jgi:fumarylacetoacetase
MIRSLDPSVKSWIPIEPDSDFSIFNIPFGIARCKKSSKTFAATRIGDTIIDLSEIARQGFFNRVCQPCPILFQQPVLNNFIALGPKVWKAVREKIFDIFILENEEIWNIEEVMNDILYPLAKVETLLPVSIPDYTDFYSSIEHATNVGVMFRDPANALLPNWRHLPVAYHGRASSIFVSGTNVHRPKGQTKTPTDINPVFGPSREVDFELETGFIIGKATQPGETIDTNNAENHIFGLLLFNDLSARDIQRWEYVPLGPFLSKNFGSIASPWIVTLDALEPFRVQGPVQEPQVLPYLQQPEQKNFNIQLEVYIEPKGETPMKICTSNMRHLYWSINQQLAHHTINGCPISVGDFYASGTISGPEPDSFGSMLELAWKGTKPVKLPDGSERVFINDYDTVTIRGFAIKNGVRIGFGEAKTTILPSI